MLVTYAAFLILEDVIRLIWGPSSYALYQPLGAAGTVDVGALVLSGYDIGLVVLAAVLAIGASFALKHTRWGRLLTVVIFDRELAAAIGVEVIVLAFAVVAIGGLGSVGGAFIGALLVGESRAAAVHLVPQVELFVIYAVMALVLVFRPQGLFTRAQPRKI